MGRKGGVPCSYSVGDCQRGRCSGGSAMRSERFVSVTLHFFELSQISYSQELPRGYRSVRQERGWRTRENHFGSPLRTCHWSGSI
jgi:hypothetical protein